MLGQKRGELGGRLALGLGLLLAAGAGCDVDTAGSGSTGDGCGPQYDACVANGGDDVHCQLVACAGGSSGAPSDEPATDPPPDPGCDGDGCDAPEDPPPSGDDSGDPGGGGDRDPCQAQYEICVEAGIGVDACAEQREGCENPPDDDTTGGDDLPPGSGDPCCEAARADCEAHGDETASTCAEIEQICASGGCETLVDVCPPTTVPVSEACAEAYNRCYGGAFLVNKCNRMSYESCMGALGDEALCTAWDQSCTDREAYCEELLSCDQGDLECGYGAPLVGSAYTCTDWGHGFDRCWAEYETCMDEPSACARELGHCSSAYIYAWEFECGGGGPYDPDDPDGPFDP